MNLPIDFSTIPLSFSLASIVNILFFVVVCIVGVISIVISFHWKKYSLSKTVFAFTELVYLVGCVVLLAIAFFSIN